MNTGIYYGMPAEAYHADPAVSRSGLVVLATQSPAHFRAWLSEEDKETPALRFGRLFHAAILEPQSFRYMLAPQGDRRTKAVQDAWKDAHAQAAEEGLYLITEDEREQLLGMQDAVYTHPKARKLLSLPGHSEVSAIWIDQETGELCKCRPDRVAGPYMIDLKSCDSAKSEDFAKSVANYLYHVQDPFYMDGYNAAGPTVIAEWFGFVAVEKSPPYAVGVHQLDFEAKEVGRDLYRRALLTLAQCKSERRWPAYSGEVETISLPRWAVAKGGIAA